MAASVLSVTSSGAHQARPCLVGTSDRAGASAEHVKSWPARLDSELAWTGSELESEQYTLILTADDKAEVDNALKIFKDLSLPASQANPSTFPLPQLHNKLRRLAVELHQGRGFFIVRGLDSNDHTAEDNAILFLGLSSHVAQRRGRQDESGSMLMHIRNAKEMVAPQEGRPARDSNQQLNFHSDMFTDILALHTRGCAATGGNHMISSATTIYNELAATRPDVIEVLGASEWTFDLRSLHAENKPRPLLFFHEGRVMLNYGRNRIVGANESLCRQRTAAAMAAAVDAAQNPSRVTPQQVEALELVQQIAEKHQLELDMQRGDLAFINNFALVHARDAFQDTDESQTRYLVRMWLKDDELAWSLPSVMARGNKATFDPKAVQVYNIDPEKRFKFKLREIFSP